MFHESTAFHFFNSEKKPSLPFSLLYLLFIFFVLISKLMKEDAGGGFRSGDKRRKRSKGSIPMQARRTPELEPNTHSLTHLFEIAEGVKTRKSEGRKGGLFLQRGERKSKSMEA